jgi:hypothetical protein
MFLFHSINKFRGFKPFFFFFMSAFLLFTFALFGEWVRKGFKASPRLSDDRLTPTGRGLERGQNLWFKNEKSGLMYFYFFA